MKESSRLTNDALILLPMQPLQRMKKSMKAATKGLQYNAIRRNSKS